MSSQKADKTGDLIETYRIKFLRTEIIFLIGVAIVSAVVSGICLILAWPASIAVIATLSSVTSIALITIRARGIREIIVRRDGISLIKIGGETPIIFAEMERLHYDSSNYSIKIETRTGHYHHIRELDRRTSKRLIMTLERAVYGETR